MDTAHKRITLVFQGLAQLWKTLRKVKRYASKYSAVILSSITTAQN